MSRGYCSGCLQPAVCEARGGCQGPIQPLPSEVRNESAVAWRIKTPTGYVRDVFDNEAEAAREADGYWKGCIEPLYSHPAQAAQEPTAAQIDAALNAWFKSPPPETDQGLERSMKAAPIAASLPLSAQRGNRFCRQNECRYPDCLVQGGICGALAVPSAEPCAFCGSTYAHCLTAGSATYCRTSSVASASRRTPITGTESCTCSSLDTGYHHVACPFSKPSAQLGCGDPYCKDPNCEYGQERHCSFCNVPMLSAECCESEFEAKGCPHSSTDLGSGK